MDSPKSETLKYWIISPETPHSALVIVLTTDRQTDSQKTTPNSDLITELHVSAQQLRQWKGTLHSNRDAVRKHCFQAQAFVLTLSNLPNPQSFWKADRGKNTNFSNFLSFITIRKNPTNQENMQQENTSFFAFWSKAFKPAQSGANKWTLIMPQPTAVDTNSKSPAVSSHLMILYFCTWYLSPWNRVPHTSGTSSFLSLADSIYIIMFISQRKAFSGFSAAGIPA